MRDPVWLGATRTNYVSLHVPTATGDPPLRIKMSRAVSTGGRSTCAPTRNAPLRSAFPNAPPRRSRVPHAPARGTIAGHVPPLRRAPPTAGRQRRSVRHRVSRRRPPRPGALPVRPAAMPSTNPRFPNQAMRRRPAPGPPPHRACARRWTRARANAERAQISRRGGGRRGVLKKRHDESM